jgi:DNA-binding NarL/FixJ family response regulator
MVTVLVCDDQTLLRKGLVALLEREPGITVVGEAVNGHEAVEQVGALAPDVVLMDMRLPVVDGAEATRLITSRYPRTRVIFLAADTSAEAVFAGIRAGATGYLLTDAAPAELAQAIRRVHEGERVIQPAVASHVVFASAAAAPPAATGRDDRPLTGRQLAVLQRLALGMSNRQIAGDLGVTEGAVKNQVWQILAKLGAANRVQAINLARQRQLI